MDRNLKRRLLIVCVVLATMLSALSARLVYVQVVEHEVLSEKARNRFVQTVTLPASRGQILDSDGEPLAQSQTVYSLVADCSHLRYDRYACAGVAKREGLSFGDVQRRYGRDEIHTKYLNHVVATLADKLRYRPEEFRKKLDAKKVGYVTLATEVEEDFRRELVKLMRENNVGGVYFKEYEQRFYPSPYTLTQVIGHVGEKPLEKGQHGFDKVYVGRAGIEKTFNQYMEGVDGSRSIQHDRQGREIVAFRGDTVPPKPGADVQLTINSQLQSYVELRLDELMDDATPEKATIIMMRPHSGEILAMASRPHFDLSTREGTTRNIAVSDLYEPGSTFKVIAAAAAMDVGMVELTTPIDCHFGNYQGKGFVLGDHSSFGTLTVSEVLQKSSNIGIYKIAQKINPEIFIDYMKRFGYGVPTGIQLTAEAKGILHDDHRKWSAPDYASMTRGYSISVTPLQVACAYSAIANGGTLMKPMIVRRVIDVNGEVVKEYRPEPVRRVMREETAKKLQDALAKVVEVGTGRRGAMSGIHAAGKTGTAKKGKPNGGYYDRRYVVSFAGYFPAENPQVVALVVVDDPHVTGMSIGGGTVAAPIFKDVAERAAQYLGIAPDQELMTLQASQLGGGR